MKVILRGEKSALALNSSFVTSVCPRTPKHLRPYSSHLRDSSRYTSSAIASRLVSPGLLISSRCYAPLLKEATNVSWNNNSSCSTSNRERSPSTTVYSTASHSLLLATCAACLGDILQLSNRLQPWHRITTSGHFSNRTSSCLRFRTVSQRLPINLFTCLKTTISIASEI